MRMKFLTLITLAGLAGLSSGPARAAEATAMRVPHAATPPIVAADWDDWHRDEWRREEWRRHEMWEARRRHEAWLRYHEWRENAYRGW